MTTAPGGTVARLIVGGLPVSTRASSCGRGFRITGDVVGLVGVLIGGFLFGVLMPSSTSGFIGSFVVAFIGAVILVSLL